MNSRVKHILIWLSAVTLLAACSDITPLEEPDQPKNPLAISFSGYQAWPADGTRADDPGSSIFAENDSIVLFATYTDDKSDTNFTSNFMKNQMVKFNGNAWSYSPLKYWPSNGKLTFRGYYPATVKFDTKDPNNWLLNTTHYCKTGFEPFYGVETVVNIDNGEFDGSVSKDGKLQLGFTPLLNKVNFTAKAEKELFNDGDPDDQYTECRFLLLTFKLWGFYSSGTYKMSDDTWTGRLYGSYVYTRQRPLDLTSALAKEIVSDVVPGYVYNPDQGYCTESAVVIHAGSNMQNIFKKSLHLIPRNYNMRNNAAFLPGFEITYVVLTNKVDENGDNVYRESGIITRVISLSEIFDDSGMTSSATHNYQLIKKLININLDFSIDAVTVTRNLKDYIYKPMF